MDKDSNDVQVSTVTANDRIITLAPFVLTCPPHATTQLIALIEQIAWWFSTGNHHHPIAFKSNSSSNKKQGYE
jgi:hypothetical protein